jgi:hypothetical protein
MKELLADIFCLLLLLCSSFYSFSISFLFLPSPPSLFAPYLHPSPLTLASNPFYSDHLPSSTFPSFASFSSLSFSSFSSFPLLSILLPKSSSQLSPTLLPLLFSFPCMYIVRIIISTYNCAYYIFLLQQTNYIMGVIVVICFKKLEWTLPHNGGS